MNKIINITRENREVKWADRIVAQLNFGRRLSQECGGAYDDVIERAEKVLEECCKDGAPISPEAVKKTEAVLEELRDEAKSYHVICTAHAHIDMNWQWGWDETVGVAIDTVTTMLKLLEEYPEFKFSLSQASTYKIIADYAPELFEQVKKYVHEGRWEVTAPSWVECDKNMPNGESLVMQLIEAKKFLSEKLEIPMDSINVDFEPDTFGHNINVPEILSHAGVKYYYHSRGTDSDHVVYRWKSPSGAEILVNREHNWYSSQISSEMGLVALELSQRQGFRTTLRVYGVGDHGGGPSRRDIEALLDMATWPCFPNFTLGTYDEFFKECEKYYDIIPLVENTEIGHLLDGCYNSQTRIKTGNKKAESELYKAGALNVIAASEGLETVPVRTQTKQDFLLAHFHDIVTGSGVAATRHHALGKYQEIFADTETVTKLAARKICQNINTKPFYKDVAAADKSFGAGVGSNQAEVGMGMRRVYQIFNSLPKEESQVVELWMWDWYGDTERLVITDSMGNVLPHQVTSPAQNRGAFDNYGNRITGPVMGRYFDHYWGHSFVKVLVYVTVPAMGYTTIIADEGDYDGTKAVYWNEKRRQWAEEFVLENEYLTVTFNPMDLTINNVVDKEKGETHFDGRAGVFQYIMEAAHKEFSNNWMSEMSSWIVGRHKSVEDLHKNCEVRHYHGIVRDGVICEFAFHNSKVKFEAYLDIGSRMLKYKTDITWLETGSHSGVPQLAFTLPTKGGSYSYDVPFGVVGRAPVGFDQPANTFAVNGDVAIYTKNVHGFRCDDEKFALTVIRAPFDPDPHPEFGDHTMEFALSFGADPVKTRETYLHPFYIMTNAPHEGTLPAEHSAVELVGAVLSTAYESGGKTVLRVYNPKMAQVDAGIKLGFTAKAAWSADYFENKEADLDLEDNKFVFISLKPNEVMTIVIEK